MDNLERKVLEHLPRGIVLLNTDLGVTFQNQAALKMLGLDLSGRQLSILSGVLSENDLKQLSDKLQRIKYASSGREVLSLEIRDDVICLDLEAVTDDAGRLNCIRIYLESIRCLVNGQKFRENLFRSMTFSLRNSITTMLGWVELIREQDSDKKLRPAISSLQRSSETARLQIDNLTYAMTLETTLPKDKLVKPVSLKNALTLACRKIESFIKEKDLMITIDVPADVKVSAWEDLLVNMLVNLIHNAAKHSPPHDDVKIIYSAQHSGGELSIRDNGAGMDEYDQQIAMSLFQFTDPSGETKHGLGLYITGKACENMNWRFWIESSRGMGTRAVIGFPQVL